MLAKVAATVTFLCLLSLPLSLRAQDSLLGHHKINLELKPLPAAEALTLLSVRSKSAAHSADRPADAGGVWEVEGAEQLAGIVVKVHFVETPVSQVVVHKEAGSPVYAQSSPAGSLSRRRSWSCRMGRR